MGRPSKQCDIYSSNIAVSISEYIIRDAVLKSSRNEQFNCAPTPYSYGTVRLAKSKILVQMSISLFSKSYGKSLQNFF